MQYNCQNYRIRIGTKDWTSKVYIRRKVIQDGIIQKAEHHKTKSYKSPNVTKGRMPHKSEYYNYIGTYISGE